MTAETPKRVGSGLPRCGVRSSGATTIAGSPASCQLSTSAWNKNEDENENENET